MGVYRDGQLADDLRRARHGEEDALEDLLGLLRPVLLRYARSQVESYVDQDELARDLVQDCLIHIVRGLHGCQASRDSQIRAWALTILRNLCIDHFRHGRSRISTVRIEVDLDGRVSQFVARSSAFLEASPMSRGRRITHRILRQAVRALPTSAQQLLHMRIEGGATWSEIAVDLHISRSAAKRRFQRLQGALRRNILRKLGQLREPDRDAVLRCLKLDP